MHLGMATPRRRPLDEGVRVAPPEAKVAPVTASLGAIKGSTGVAARQGPRGVAPGFPPSAGPTRPVLPVLGSPIIVVRRLIEPKGPRRLLPVAARRPAADAERTNGPIGEVAAPFPVAPGDAKAVPEAAIGAGRTSIEAGGARPPAFLETILRGGGVPAHQVPKVLVAAVVPAIAEGGVTLQAVVGAPSMGQVA